MIILDQMISDINALADFLGVRDVPVLDGKHLLPSIGKEQADVMVLFSGSILAGGDVLAAAMQNQIAKIYMIVGGEGHTTHALRKQLTYSHA